MQRARIAVATQEKTPELTADDRLALDLLLKEEGIAVEAIPWSRPGTDWSGFAAVLIRNTWDYHRHLEAFRAWAREVEASGAKLWNPAAVVAWNSEKTYLRDLEAAGIPIVPTRWVEKDEATSLAALLAEPGWAEVVVKPTVSASAYRTWKIAQAKAEAHQQDFEALLADSGAMIQPLLPEVRNDGEWSFLFFRQDGALAFSHAVLKKPAEGDFRVQSELGGSAIHQDPPAELLEQIQRLVTTAAKIAPGPLLYARIDGVVSQGQNAPAGSFLLMELELIEPFLFLGCCDAAARNFAAAVGSVLAEPCLKAELLAPRKKVASLPVLDERAPEEILDDDEQGLPS